MKRKVSQSGSRAGDRPLTSLVPYHWAKPAHCSCLTTSELLQPWVSTRRNTNSTSIHTHNGQWMIIDNSLLDNFPPRHSHRQRVSTTFFTWKNSQFLCVLVMGLDSNLQSLDFESDALSTEPPRHFHICHQSICHPNMAIRPSTDQLHHKPLLLVLICFGL